MLQTRLLTALVALPPLIALVLFAPRAVFGIFILLVTAVALYEAWAMLAAGSALRTVALIVPALAAGSWLALIGVPDSTVPALVIGAMLALTGWFEVTGTTRLPPRWSIAALAGIYVGLLFPYFALLRAMKGGVSYLVLLLAVVMAGDSGAYFVGRLVGRTKLAPRVSPGKTVEGAIGSVCGSLLAAAAIAWLLGIRWSWPMLMLYALIANLLGQGGDLAESALKRLAGAKDSGWIFPGHGGLLDRTDSLVFAAVFSYYFIR